MIRPTATRRREIVQKLAASAHDLGWVIEAGWTSTAKPDYWCGVEVLGDGVCQHHWNPDNLQAVRFAREADARVVARCLLETESYRVCEHIWS